MKRKNLNYPMIRKLWYIDGPSDLNTKHFDERNYGATKRDFIILVLLMWIIGAFDLYLQFEMNSLIRFISNVIKWGLSTMIGYVVMSYSIYTLDFRSIYNNILEKEKKEEESKNKTSN